MQYVTYDMLYITWNEGVKKLGKIISINNFKGGVSKTSTACALAYIFAVTKGVKKLGKIISINNFKGGVSKTSTACALAYILSEKKGMKTLLVDFDPQADATELLIRTYDNAEKPDALNDEGYKTIYEGIKNGD